MPAVPMIVPATPQEGNLVRDVPGGRPIGLGNQLNTVDDPIARQHIFVIAAILIGQKSGVQVMVRFAQYFSSVLARTMG